MVGGGGVVDVDVAPAFGRRPEPARGILLEHHGLRAARVGDRHGEPRGQDPGTGARRVGVLVESHRAPVDEHEEMRTVPLDVRVPRALEHRIRELPALPGASDQLVEGHAVGTLEHGPVETVVVEELGLRLLPGAGRHGGEHLESDVRRPGGRGAGEERRRQSGHHPGGRHRRSGVTHGCISQVWSRWLTEHRAPVGRFARRSALRPRCFQTLRRIRTREPEQPIRAPDGSRPPDRRSPVSARLRYSSIFSIRFEGSYLLLHAGINHYINDITGPGSRSRARRGRSRTAAGPRSSPGQAARGVPEGFLNDRSSEATCRS